MISRRFGPRWAMVGVAAAIAATAACGQTRADVAGRWAATVQVNGVEVPFDFEIAGRDAGIEASFFNGERRITSQPAGRGETLVFQFPQYGATLTAVQRDGALEGEYTRGARGTYPFRATRAVAEASMAAVEAPSIDGTWVLAAKSNKGETAWRFIAAQRGAQVNATILRVDGDTGTLSGTYQDGRFVLGHFSGARPLRLEVTVEGDGTLRLVQNGKTELRAVRAETADASAIGAPTDPSAHTSVADPTEPFRFAFPDLTGEVVANTDPRFRGKVVLVNISGSWCPNCHDEAPFLASLDEKYRAQGLEIVTLSFEEREQLADPVRLRAFIAQYGLKYTVLLAGEPEELNDKVPQGVNLNAFPTTFLLGRDGRVRRVHAGFPSPGSGEFYRQAERDITTDVEHLLAERAAAVTD